MENSNNPQIKLNEDEQRELIELDREYNLIVTKLGEISITREELSEELEKLSEIKLKYIKEYEDLKKTESIYLKRLKVKYGDGDLDPESGIYIKKI